MTVVAVTGISGHVGRGLLPLLEQDPTVERIIGIDLVPPAQGGTKVEFHRADVRDEGIVALFQGADVVVHLAFILFLRPGQPDDWPDEVNIGGSQNVARAAAQAGVRRFVTLSSLLAYGGRPDNPIPILESYPLRGRLDFFYSRAKVMLERFLARFAREHPEMTVTILRACGVMGPRADPDRMAGYTTRPFFAIRNGPPMQMVHEEDVATAIHLAVRRDLPGAYNLAPDDWVKMADVMRAIGWPVLELPYGLVRLLTSLAYRTGRSLIHPKMLDELRYPIILSNVRLRAQGWAPRYSSRETFYAGLLLPLQGKRHVAGEAGAPSR
ncbi:MAG: NAD-dependent epimerase/dehydratase family protein [Chloroflexi bacterium]|nr:MAG: NAD-dependent epimerase/dehydratase family protein [Chloroflexota bacterium]